MTSWEDLRAKLDLDEKNISLQANYPHNPSWLEINVFRSNLSNFIINKHHLIKKHQIYCLEKLISREIYNMQLILIKNIYCSNRF